MNTTYRSPRQGKIIVLVAIMMPILVGFGAFAIDVGHVAFSRSRLQAGADSAALAAADELPGTQATLETVALRYAKLNHPAAVSLIVTVEGGTWNESSATFTPADLSAASAVRVTVEQPNTVLHLGSFGKSLVNLTTSAIATKAENAGTRFLIDDEMIDTDIPAIQSLAASTGRSTSQLLTARGFNLGKQYGASNWTWRDNFLDLPAGVTLSLPTGQATGYSNNDSGMFDIDHPAFPFQDDTSFRQFLMYSETGNDPSKWGTDYSNIKSQLDPLPGTAPVTDGSTYESFVDPNYVHVSPVTFSDLSTLNMEGGVPRINAKGLRRGLIAFKIIGVGSDIDGGGSVLPMLNVQTVDPATLTLDDVKHYNKKVLFRLVR